MITLVVADLAGTMVDFGSCAPAGAFVELFSQRGICITLEQARGPMGLHKRDHIRALLELPDVKQQWEEKFGRGWNAQDLNALYDAFVPLQMKCLPEYCGLIPGVLEAARELAEKGVKLVATTGYNREMLELVLEAMRSQGLDPDAAFCAADVPQGRPAPWMIFRAMEALGVYPPASVIKIGDTLPDIEAGCNAGAWSVGVTATGNMAGLSEGDWNSLPEEEQCRRNEEAAAIMRDAGAHYVLSGFEELPALVDEINARLAQGE